MEGSLVAVFAGGDAAQLARNASAFSDADPGSAVKVYRVCPSSPGRSSVSNWDSVPLPIGASPPWWQRLRTNRGRSPLPPDRGRGTGPGSAAGPEPPDQRLLWTRTPARTARAPRSWRPARPSVRSAPGRPLRSSRPANAILRDGPSAAVAGAPAAGRTGCWPSWPSPSDASALPHPAEGRRPQRRGPSPRRRGCCRVPAACNSPCLPRPAVPLPPDAAPERGAVRHSWGARPDPG